MWLIEHDKHGFMHVYSEPELKRHIDWGWKEVTDNLSERKRKLKHETQQEPPEGGFFSPRRGRPKKG